MLPKRNCVFQTITLFLLLIASPFMWAQVPPPSAGQHSGFDLQAEINSTAELNLPCGLYFLKNGLIVSSANHHISGSGPCTVLSFSGGPLDYAIAISASNIELDHLTIGAAPGVLGRGVSIGDASHIYLHNLTISGAGTIPPPRSGLPAAIRFLNVTDLVIRDNDISGTGPASGNSGGFDILSDSGASRGVTVEGNHIHGSNSQSCIALFNVDDATVQNNVIDQSHAFDHSVPEDRGQGYGILLYGAGQRLIASKPSGLVRAHNVVVMTTETPHVFAVGQHIVINQALSIGGSDFNGDFKVSSVPTKTTLTFVQDGPDDTGGDGIVNPSFSSARVEMNTVTNTSGSGIYLQGYTDSFVERNVVTNYGQLMQDTSLPEGGIALMSPMRVIVKDNYVDGSIQSGVAFAAGHAVTITNNIISHVKYGVQARGVNRDVHVSGNIISSAQLGISLPPSAPKDVFELIDNTVCENNAQARNSGSESRRAQ